MLKTKATDDDIDEGDDEDKHSGGIVQGICCLLVFLIIDIQTSKYQEQNPKQDLEKQIHSNSLQE